MRTAPIAPRLPVVGALPFLRYGRSDFLLTTGRRLGDAYWLHVGSERVLVVGHPEAAARVLENVEGSFPEKGSATGFRRNTLPFVGAGLSTWNAMDPAWRARRSAVARVFRQAKAPENWMLPDGRITGPELRRLIAEQVVRSLAKEFLGVEASPEHAADVVASFNSLGAGFWTGKLPWPQPIHTARARRATARLEAIADAWVAGAPDSAPIHHHLPDLGPDRIRDEVLSQLLSVGTLTIPAEWALHLLADHRDVQNAIRSELVDGDLGLLQRVVREALRLCPSTYWIQRRAAHDNELAGVRIAAGDIVVVHVPSVHRHPDYWEAPDDFRPDRFRGAGWKYAWMPFGRAARLCVAQHYSIDLISAVLVDILTTRDVTGLSSRRPQLGTGLNLIPRAGALLLTPL